MDVLAGCRVVWGPLTVGADAVRISWVWHDGAEFHLLGWGVVVGGRLVGDAVQRGEDEIARAGDVVAGGLQLALLWEEEQEAASLAGVRLGEIDIKAFRSVSVCTWGVVCRFAYMVHLSEVMVASKAKTGQQRCRVVEEGFKILYCVP